MLTVLSRAYHGGYENPKKGLVVQEDHPKAETLLCRVWGFELET